MRAVANNLDLERQAHGLLESSADLSGAVQLNFLYAACRDNEPLLTHCLSILSCQVSDDDFIELVYGNVNNGSELHGLIGTTIGNYRIDKLIGQGGTAEVFLAYRNDDVHYQPVALKIIRGWGDASELKARMKRERKILSQFKHPNIANFIDGGNAEDGRPYFVLEYIQGTPITDYCREKNLDLNDRLTLFMDVCSAVYAAHAKLTLHRDLKPANILVTDEGVPKLLDFGIAKILSGESDDNTQLTRFVSPMTPQYASPEQIKQLPLSVASDQYSLGVLLYELITGHLPHDDTENKILCVANDTGITQPSVRITEKESAGKHVGSRFAKQLKGDMDAIVLKALKTDTEQRYSSVKEFSEDIHRFLKNKTVLAQKSSCWYQISRFYKRNRKNTIVVVGLLCTMLFIGISQQIKIIQERDQAIVERRKFEETQGFLLGLFKLSHPEKNRNQEITAQEILGRGVEDIRDKFSDQPNIKIALLSTMGRAYQNLQLNNKAFELQMESMKLQERHVRVPGETMAVTLTSLADLLIEKGGNHQARAFIGRSLDIFSSLKSKDPVNYAEAYTVAGILANRLGEYREGIDYLLKSLEIRQQHFDKNDPEIVKSYMALGIIYTGKGDYEQAQIYNKLALELKNKNPDHDPVTTSSIYNTMAVVSHFQGKFSKALHLYQKSIEIRIALFGKNSPMLVKLYNNVAELYTATGEYDNAIEYHQKSLRILQENNNTERYLLAVTHNRLGDALAGKRQHYQALQHIDASLQIRKVIYGEHHHDVAKSYDSYGSVYAGMGDVQKAVDYYQKAIVIRTEAYGADHLLTQETQSKLRNVY